MAKILEYPPELQKAFDKMTEDKKNEILEDNIYLLTAYDVPFEYIDEYAYYTQDYHENDPKRLSGAVSDVIYSFLRSGSTNWILSRKIDENGFIQGYRDGIKEKLSKLLLKQKNIFNVNQEITWIKDNQGNNIPLLNDNFFMACLTYATEIHRENHKKVFSLYEYNNKTRFIYDPIYWSEINIAKRLYDIINAPSSINENDKKEALKFSASIHDINKEQQNAIQSVFENKVSIITGGAGTGKTHVIQKIVESCMNANDNLQLRITAPTGIASQNVQDRIEHSQYKSVQDYADIYKAQTIHRLLALRPSEFKSGAISKYSYRYNPLLTDVLIMEESSMIDTILFSSLLWAVPDETHIVIVGDPNQLSSVGPGRVLYDLTHELQRRFRNIDMNKPKWTALNEVHRSKEDTNIANLSVALLRNDKKQRWKEFQHELETCKQRGSVEFYHANAILEKTIELFYQYEENAHIITPRHKGEASRQAINSEILKQKKKSGYDKDVPVIQNKNNYDMGVLNGERGSIVSADKDQVTVSFSDNLKLTYPYFTAEDELLIGYATTVHKSQGTEADVIILPVWEADNKPVWDVTLLYTALTRAKKKVILIGSEETLEKSMIRSRMNQRTTTLAYRYMSKNKI